MGSKHVHRVNTGGIPPGINALAQCTVPDCEEEILVEIPPEDDESN